MDETSPRDLWVVMIWHPSRLQWTIVNREEDVRFDQFAAEERLQRLQSNNRDKVFRLVRYRASNVYPP